MSEEAKPRRVLIILGHGRSDGLGRHLLEVVAETARGADAEVRVHDLLADGFDPVLRLSARARHATGVAEADDPIAFRYQEDVRWADRYVFIHPVWWFAPPAILKGWIDRVLAEGVALEYPASGSPQGLLGGRGALLVQTFGAGATVDRLVFKGMARSFWKHAVFAPIGLDEVAHTSIYSADKLSPESLAKHTRKLVQSTCTLLGVRSPRS